MPTRYVDRLTPLARAGNLAQARALAESLSAEERREAAEWLANCRRWFAATRNDVDGAPHSDESSRNWGVFPWIVAFSAVEICSPAAAVKVVPWDDLWGRRNSHIDEFVALLCAKPRDWALSFLAATDHASLSNGGWSGTTFSTIIRAVGRHHQSPCPVGPAFYDAWLAGCPEADMVEAVANDPWMPELLEHYLDTGGTDSRVLENLPEWIRRGTASRERLMAAAFAQLTTPRRPGSQNMLAKILASLDFQASEVPGGLDYLLGLIATASGPAGKILLPAAIELVRDDTEAQQLAAVIAARSEKAQKATLVTALTKTWADRISKPTAVAALTLFLDDPDTAFADKVRAQLNKIDPTAAAAAPAAAADVALGLWELSPIPATAEEKKKFPGDDWINWTLFLTMQGRPKDIEQAKFVDKILTAVAEGNLDQIDAFARLVRRLMDSQELTLSRVTNMLPDLFLGGGMKAMWPVALEIADYASWRSSVPPTLADLLRQLTSFAADAPSQPLPYNLAELAARPGKTKAQAEARVLATALRHPGERLADPIAATASLWRVEPPTVTMPQDQVLLARDWDVAVLGQIAALEGRYSTSRYPMELLTKDDPRRRMPHFWVADQALASAVRRIHDGADEHLRTTLLAVRRRDRPDPTSTAMFLWATGLLNPQLYWRLARHVQTASGWSGGTHEAHAQWNDTTDLSQCLTTLDPDEVILLPEQLAGTHGHLEFLRGCEGLLLADRQRVSLSEPEFADGTIEFETLKTRLDEGAAQLFGPLDAVQALYRLREVDPAWAGKVPSGRWFTAPELTSADGSAPPLDVGELLRAWVAGGGLPPLDLHPVADYRPWESMATTPVSWSVCAAAPAELGTTLHKTGSVGALRTYPGWGDLADGFFDGARGPLGLHAHAELISAWCASRNVEDPTILIRVLDQFRAGRVDPGLAARAVALPSAQRPSYGPGLFGALAGLFGALFDGGAMIPAWPVAVAIAAAGCNEDVGWMPAELVERLSRYARHVPLPRASTEQLNALRLTAESADSAERARLAQWLLHVLQDE